MNDSDNQRRSFRVSESALVQYEIIEEGNSGTGLDRSRLLAGSGKGIRSKVLDLDARLDELLFRVRNDLPSVCSAIEILNQKLNVVLEALPESQESKEALADQPAQMCELSADGMVFRTDELLPPGTKLMLRFLLIFDHRLFETLCRVIRVIERDEVSDNTFNYRIAVEFEGMSAAERELLIQHLFSKESDTLRMRRLEAEPAV